MCVLLQFRLVIVQGKYVFLVSSQDSFLMWQMFCRTPCIVVFLCHCILIFSFYLLLSLNTCTGLLCVSVDVWKIKIKKKHSYPGWSTYGLFFIVLQIRMHLHQTMLLRRCIFQSNSIALTCTKSPHKKQKSTTTNCIEHTVFFIDVTYIFSYARLFHSKQIANASGDEARRRKKKMINLFTNLLWAIVFTSSAPALVFELPQKST